jgi:DNA processing protein
LPPSTKHDFAVHPPVRLFLIHEKELTMSATMRMLLMLTQVPGVGPHRLRALVDCFHDPRRILDAPLHDLLRAEGIDQRTARAIQSFAGGNGFSAATQFADEQLARLEAAGGAIVTVWDGSYPKALRKIYDPPPLLFIRGTLEEDDQMSLAVVGTRAPSPYGIQVAERFGADLARAGLVVVSGLARGIDTAAHGASLKAGGRTLAVIGSGIDVVYPPENRALAEAITARGAIVSEYPMGTKPDAMNFPRRNRIISGISLGTIVVETGKDGGAMITAATALDQNREVFAVPAPVSPRRESGTNRLIHDGKAMLVETLEDVLAELAPRLKRRVYPAERTELSPPEDLSLFESRIWNALAEDQPMHVDLLAGVTGMPVAEVLVHLLTLEFRGLVRQAPGKFFLRGGKN